MWRWAPRGAAPRPLRGTPPGTTRQPRVLRRRRSSCSRSPANGSHIGRHGENVRRQHLLTRVAVPEPGDAGAERVERQPRPSRVVLGGGEQVQELTPHHDLPAATDWIHGDTVRPELSKMLSRRDEFQGYRPPCYTAGGHCAQFQACRPPLRSGCPRRAEWATTEHGDAMAGP